MSKIDPAAPPPAPSIFDPGQDPAVLAPLVAFHGGVPPAPPWFTSALAAAPERRFIEVEGSLIETLIWGPEGAPGLLFLHGNGAHADWWSFIAPYFAKDWRVAAMSWSGMGRSGWRERYSVDGFVEEALAVAEGAGLFAGPQKPLVVAHSFGGSIAASLAARRGDRLGGAVIVDSGARPPAQQWRGPPSRNRPNSIYKNLKDALARFRLMPPQPCANAFIVDYIARQGLMEVSEGSGDPGWTWRFDPFIWSKMDFSRALESGEELARAKCRLAFVWGAQSKLMTSEVIDYSKSHAAFRTPFVEIPQSEHHILLDQPLALVAALNALFAAWA